MEIRISGLVNDSIVDGPGFRYTVFTQGCKFNCPGCHNPHTHDVAGGRLIDIDEILCEVKQNPLLSGVTISGGEPFLQIPETLELTKKVKALNLDVIIYTGYRYEELIQMNNTKINNILKIADYLIDGRFMIEKRSLELNFKGSSNQRIIDLKKTYIESKLVETDFSNY